VNLKKKSNTKNLRLLLMGSSAFKDRELPDEIKMRIDDAMAKKMTIIVGEALGANRLYQDYLKSKGYRNVIVGHAIRFRYNAGNWTDIQYGKDLKERERKMIEDCDSAIVIWMNNSGVIANNLEILKRLKKPTFIYEYSSDTEQTRAGELDPKRIYNPYHYMKTRYRTQNHKQR
jgi:hypothetical protein